MNTKLQKIVKRHLGERAMRINKYTFLCVKLNDNLQHLFFELKNFTQNYEEIITFEEEQEDFIRKAL